MREKQIRVTQLDIVKGIGIILVIFGHLAERNQISRILVYSFHMPLFFAISGYLSKPTTIKEIFEKGIRKLVLPTYLILTLDCLIRVVESLLSLNSWPSISEWINGLLIHGGVLWNLPVWFLMTLFVCRILGQLNNRILWIIFAICDLICIVGVNTKVPQWWLTNTIMAFPFYYLGLISRQYNILKLWNNTKIRWKIIGLCVWIVIALYNGYTDINTHSNGKNYALFLITGVLGTLLLTELANVIKGTKLGYLAEILGKKSMFVLISHYYICRGIVPKFLNYFDVNSNIGIQILLTMIIVLIYYLFFKIKEKGNLISECK